MPSEAVDGMSFEAVYDAVKKAADRARKGEGPTLLEMKTYRYKGHSMSDPAKYRTKEEVEDYKKQDPIQQVLNTIIKNKYASDEELEAIQARVKAEVEECVKFSEESPFPEASELYEYVYVQSDYPFIKE
jgi:pyruvate dehydrogenase E1 component alpha subunit